MKTLAAHIDEQIQAFAKSRGRNAFILNTDSGPTKAIEPQILLQDKFITFATPPCRRFSLSR
jgi:hypothetical protein